LTAMWNREKTLVISSPNLGGLSKITDDGIEVIDAISTTGISSDDSLFVRSLQHGDHAAFELQHRDGSSKRFIYKDIWDIHDVFLVNDHFYAVSSGSNEVVLISVKSGDIVQRWTYPGENDSWHLNGLGRWNGRMVVSAFGHFQTHRGYIGHSYQNGFIMDLQSSNIRWGQLTEPHSPKCVDSNYYICDSGTGRLLISDGNKVITEIPLKGYPRGLAVTSRYIAVGISRRRHLADSGYGSVELLNKNSLQQEKEFILPFPEIYDLQLVSPQLAALLKPAK
jgi:hypothetical protein